MKRYIVFGAIVAALAVPGVAEADGATVVPQRFCQVQFLDGGPIYDGVGISVQTPSGSNMVVCRVTVPPPPETIVMTSTMPNGDLFVVTKSGMAIVVAQQ